MANVNLLLGPLLSCYSYRLQVLSGSPEMNLVYTVKKKKKKVHTVETAYSDHGYYDQTRIS